MQELAMTKEQYDQVMQEISSNHAFGINLKDSEMRQKQKHIKYVRPNWDMRDGMCFSITFEGLTTGMTGKTFGSGYKETKPLYEQVMDWLNDPLPPPIIHDVNGRG